MNQNSGNGVSRYFIFHFSNHLISDFDFSPEDTKDYTKKISILGFFKSLTTVFTPRKLQIQSDPVSKAKAARYARFRSNNLQLICCIA